jgi:hypothetical protein
MALESLSEHLPVARAFDLLIEFGASHKNVAVRGVIAKVLADMSEKLEQERLMDPAEKATLNKLLEAEIKLILDHSLEVR